MTNKKQYNMENLNLEEPIVFIDIETTGLNIYKDRIIQIATHKVFPDGKTEDKCILINPMMPISKEASDIHGITDEMVKDKPVFARIAKNFYNYIKDETLATYNGEHFDLPMLAEEFYRAGEIIFPIKGVTKLIDVIDIERKVNSHKLTETYKRYTGEDYENAHDALHDCKATKSVLFGQLSRFKLSPKIDDLIELAKPKNKNTEVEFLDLKQQLYRKDGNVYWNFGKHKDKMIGVDKSYIQWFLTGEFPIHTKLIIRDILDGLS